MKLATFFEKFELFAEAPDAVARMREVVLELAVRGRLLPQDVRDQPASALLQAVKAERAKLVIEKTIKSRSTSQIEPDEQPYALPSNWEWARLMDVGHELGQKVPDKRFTYIDVSSINSIKGCISDRVEQLEPNEAPSRARKQVSNGTVIYSTVRPYLLNIAIVDQLFDAEPIASTAFAILHPFTGINNRYLFYWLRSAPFIAYVQASMKGMAYPAVNDEKFYNGLIALPPSEEQKRIVTKVDELMALCDQLEAQQQERQTRHTALVHASLARFTQAPTPANLQFLFHPSYTVSPADLRKTILTLAVQGKLVPQDPEDEPTESLLRVIENRRKTLLDSGSIKKTKPCRHANKGEYPYDIPEGWQWSLLGEITNIGTGSTPSRTEGSYWIGGSIPWITSGATSQTHIKQGEEFVTPEAVRAHRLNIYEPGTLLVALYGQGKTRGQVATLKLSATINQACAAICPIDGVPSMQEYIKLLLEKQYDEMREMAAGGAQPNLNVQKIKEIFVPLPPLAEQRRIVAKVDELMTLVDDLEHQMAASRAVAHNLLVALVRELTASP